jgi:hypothetical protein
MKLQLNCAIWAYFQTLGECAPLVAKLNTLTIMAKKGNTWELNSMVQFEKIFHEFLFSSLNMFLFILLIFILII